MIGGAECGVSPSERWVDEITLSAGNGCFRTLLRGMMGMMGMMGLGGRHG